MAIGRLGLARGGVGGLGLVGARNWWLSGSAFDLNFATGQYFGGSLATLTSISRASIGYVTNSDSSLTLFQANQRRIGVGTGLLVEEARTNVVLWNRDLTNAAWVKSNVTAAMDQTGADGAANGASSIIATAGNGTCLQAITLASAAAFQSAYVKRLVGSGAIQMTMDNGATWTAIAVTSSYTQLTIPTQTLANPTVGFRIVTSGDKIAVDLVQNEGSTFGTSPIPTTTVAVTRAADVVTLSGPALTLALAATKSVVCAFNKYTTTTRGIAFSANAAFNGHPDFNIDGQNNAQLRAYIETGTTDFAALTLAGYAANVTSKVGLSASAGIASAVANGGTVATGTYTSPEVLTVAELGSFVGLQFLNGYMPRLTLWNTLLPDATLRSLTA